MTSSSCLLVFCGRY